MLENLSNNQILLWSGWGLLDDFPTGSTGHWWTMLIIKGYTSTTNMVFLVDNTNNKFYIGNGTNWKEL